MPFSVQTGLKLYENMVVTSLDADQDVSTANVLRFRPRFARCSSSPQIR